jgi:heme exporter protein B
MTSLPAQTRLLARAELRAERRAGEVVMVVAPFGVVALLIAPMAIGVDIALLSRIGPGLFWVVVLLFGLTVTQRRTAAWDPAHHEVLQLLGVDPAARFCATAIASTALVLGFQGVVGGAMAVLYDPTITGWWWLVAVLPLTAAGIAMIGTLAGSIAQGVGSRTTLAPLLAAPLSIPILLAGAQAMEGLRQGTGILRWIAMLALVDVLLAVTGVLTARPLEEASA